jgi:hypothetical protein
MPNTVKRTLRLNDLQQEQEFSFISFSMSLDEAASPNAAPPMLPSAIKESIVKQYIIQRIKL